MDAIGLEVSNIRQHDSLYKVQTKNFFDWLANQNSQNYIEILPEENHPHMKIFQVLNLSFLDLN